MEAGPDRDPQARERQCRDREFNDAARVARLAIAVENPSPGGGLGHRGCVRIFHDQRCCPVEPRASESMRGQRRKKQRSYGGYSILTRKQDEFVTQIRAVWALLRRTRRGAT